MNKLALIDKERNTIDTREVADMMGIQHKLILRKLEGTKDGKTKGIIPILTNEKIVVSDYFIESSYIDAKGETRKCYLVTIYGVKAILDNTRNYKNKKELFNWYYKNTKQEIAPILVNREEIDFINMLEESLKPYGLFGIRQYKVISENGDIYYIDYYIPKLNIAIEYDEGCHVGYSYEKHEGRQIKIEALLKCRFIRVANKETNSYNVGQVIKEIFNINI